VLCQAKKFLEGTELKEQIGEEVEHAYELNVSGVPYFIIDKKCALSPVICAELDSLCCRYQLSGAQEAGTFLNVFKKLGIYNS